MKYNSATTAYLTISAEIKSKVLMSSEIPSKEITDKDHSEEQEEMRPGDKQRRCAGRWTCGDISLVLRA